MTVVSGRLADRLSELLDFLLPPACLGCRGRLPTASPDRLVCAPCLSRLSPLSTPGCVRCGFPLGTGAPGGVDCLECRGWPPGLTVVRSAYELRPPADALVHALKYGGWARLAEPMAARMARISLPEAWRQGVFLAPVPTTAARRRTRGYNQAELLAEGMAETLDAPLVRALVRAHGRRTQTALHPGERQANVRGAFAARTGLRDTLNDARVLLVDDVLTTGATASAAACALLEAGASSVGLITYARALPFRPDRSPPVR